MVRIKGNWHDSTPFSVALSFPINIDNVVLHEIPPPSACINPPLSDVSGDCKVTLVDIAMIAAEWMHCGFAEQTGCWS